MLVLNQCVLKQSSGGSSDPVDLFQGGDVGFFANFKVGQSPMYTDQSGTTALTSNGETCRHFKSLAPVTTDDFSGADGYTYTTGTYPYVTIPASNRGLASGDFASWLSGKAGSTFCVAGYSVSTGAMCIPIWYYGDGTNTTYLYVSAGVWSFNAKRGGSEIAATALASRYGEWVVATGVADLSNGAVKIRINGTQEASTAISAGNYGTSTDASVGMNASWATGAETRVAASFAINRVLSGDELAALETWMKSRVGLT